MQLSPHFSLQELTVTSHPIANVPNPTQLRNLTATAAGMERVRAILGQPITVNSAFRSPAVNKAVGGASTSAHLDGWAVDFVCPVFGSPYDICAALLKAGLKFDQLIHENRRWVHVSFDPKMRGQMLTFDGHAYHAGLAR